MDVVEVLTIVALVLWIVLSLSVIAGVAAAFPTLRKLGNLVTHLDRTIQRTEGKLEPVIDHLERSADNVDYVTSVLRSDVDRMGDTVEQAAESTRRMLEMAEERASEIHGFLDVVQEEAEQTFLSTASFLRAVRGERRRSVVGDGDPGDRRSA